MATQDHISINDFTRYSWQYLIGNRSLVSPLFVKGSTASRITTTVAFEFTVAGIMYTSGALTNKTWGTVATSGVLLTAQAAIEARWYCLSINSAGTFYVTQGPAAATVALAQKPDPYTSLTTGVIDTTVLGYISVVTANAATFTPGTTAFDATDVTSVFYNVSVPIP